MLKFVEAMQEKTTGSNLLLSMNCSPSALTVSMHGRRMRSMNTSSSFDFQVNVLLTARSNTDRKQ